MVLIQSTEKHFFTIQKVLYPAIVTFINNCYSTPSDLFIQRGKVIKPLDGTTQGDPTAVAIYTLGIIPLLARLSKLYNESTEQPP